MLIVFKLKVRCLKAKKKHPLKAMKTMSNSLAFYLQNAAISGPPTKEAAQTYSITKT